MSDFQVNDKVQAIISELIIKNNWGPVVDIKYKPGTELGDGYSCTHISVDIIRENDTLRLFLKYPTGLKLFENDVDVDKFYENEVIFYDKVCTIYNKFLKDKNQVSKLENVPNSYRTSAKTVVVLEDLKHKGYQLFNRFKFMNDQHIRLVLKSFAKFHGTSFAFKDQRRIEYDELTSAIWPSLFANQSEDSMYMKMNRNEMERTLNKFDPLKDKHLLDRCNVDVLFKALRKLVYTPDEYSIIIKGDCWLNNMMFLYKDDDKDNPIDVMQLDWQLIEVSSPIYDISYFFYTVASEEALSKLDDYLRFYHTELSEQIRKLGSDPELLYPFSVFEMEWKRYCTYGFALAFMIFRALLANHDEIPKMDEIEVENYNDDMELFAKFDNEQEYINRIKILAEFVVKRGYI
ncbi:hypothetical protein MML48_2g00002818 [Holotrichia oblita]|uniref:Uncharacterized protein n=1 Tax=Holotrichia oblita TaxID=644536 RepID=A0ACB9TIF5_HOLOL|nr:hypothetical protein MML48_2g00002818 [Holotrichia oblita]